MNYFTPNHKLKQNELVSVIYILVFNDPPPLGLLVINLIYLTFGLVTYFNKKKFNT